jgi:hypothetical protein
VREPLAIVLRACWFFAIGAAQSGNEWPWSCEVQIAAAVASRLATKTVPPFATSTSESPPPVPVPVFSTSGKVWPPSCEPQ